MTQLASHVTPSCVSECVVTVSKTIAKSDQQDAREKSGIKIMRAVLIIAKIAERHSP